jgi:hypothetical protein
MPWLCTILGVEGCSPCGEGRATLPVTWQVTPCHGLEQGFGAQVEQQELLVVWVRATRCAV